MYKIRMEKTNEITTYREESTFWTCFGNVTYRTENTCRFLITWQLILQIVCQIARVPYALRIANTIWNIHVYTGMEINVEGNYPLFTRSNRYAIKSVLNWKFVKRGALLFPYNWNSLKGARNRIEIWCDFKYKASRRCCSRWIYNLQLYEYSYGHVIYIISWFRIRSLLFQQRYESEKSTMINLIVNETLNEIM